MLGSGIHTQVLGPLVHPGLCEAKHIIQIRFQFLKFETFLPQSTRSRLCTMYCASSF
jgi:hypothetical protein